MEIMWESLSQSEETFKSKVVFFFFGFSLFFFCFLFFPSCCQKRMGVRMEEGEGVDLRDALYCKGPWGRDLGCPLGAKRVPAWQLTRKRGLRSCNHKGLNTANDLNELRSEFFPKPKLGEADPLISVLWDSRQRILWNQPRLLTYTTMR